MGGEGQGNREEGVTNDTMDDVADIRTIWVNHSSLQCDNIVLYNQIVGDKVSGQKAIRCENAEYKIPDGTREGSN